MSPFIALTANSIDASEFRHQRNCEITVDSIGGISVIKIGSFFDSSFIQRLNDTFDAADSKRSDVFGKTGSGLSKDVGSDRASIITSDELSNSILESVKLHLASFQINTRWLLDLKSGRYIKSPKEHWKIVGVNNYWRFIQYQPGDGLVPHYDEAYIYPGSSKKMTLTSMVIYLSKGETSFMEDTRQPRTFTDENALWEGQNEILTAECQPGDILLFDHNLFHAGPVVTQQKRIIRTDLVWEQ